MNKQSISFEANEQKLTKTGGIEHYASNIVAYIEATFDLGTNWNGYDSVRAVWSNDYLTDISTVLDPDGKCIVPTEVLTDTGNVTVNLVGSIADGDTLTDRLTTYPCKAVIVDADAKVEGEETESITPSQFEQFVEIVHDEVEQVTGMTAEAETLPAGSDATASYSDGVLSFGIPKGDKGEQGEQGETGHTGEPAGFGDVTASVDNTVGTPSVNVTASGPDTAKEFDFEFHNLKGEQGDTGETGETGNGIASTVLNPDYTLTITFTDGTSYTTPSIRGAKGDTGDTGATGNGIQSTVLNADYTLTITFTDGTSYTTPSIRGEQGPAGPVSDVTVNGTSVVDQNGVAVITMPELVKTVNGNPIVIDDAFGEVKNLDVELLPIQDLNGYDKPWAGGAGKNKFLSHAESETRGGVTFTANADGTITANGTATADIIYEISEKDPTSPNACYTHLDTMGIKADTSYRLNGAPSGGGTAYRLQLLVYGSGIEPYDTGSGSSAFTFTQSDIDTKWYRFAIRVTNGTQLSNVVFKPMIYLASEADNTYAPYSNICPITGHDSVTVGDTGVNQFDEQWEQGGLNGTTGEETSSTSFSRSEFFKAYPNTTYYVYGSEITGTTEVFVFPYKADGTYISPYTKLTANGTYTTPQGCEQIRLQVRRTIDTVVNYKYSINLPSTDTAYHAYHGQSKTVTLPHTVYGAGVGVTSGTGKDNTTMLDMGALSWTYDSTYKRFYTADTENIIKRPSSNNDKAEILSSSYDTVAHATLVGDTTLDGVISCPMNGRVSVRNLAYTSASDFKTAMNGVQLCIALATPLDLSTTPTDITLYNGDNVVSSDGDMELTYVQDMAIVIRKIESQL